VTSDRKLSGSKEAIEPMLRMLNGHCLQQALHVAAVLGIGDLMHGGMQSIDELANATGADGPSLRRLLRALSGVAVFSEMPNGCFELTSLGQTLRSDVPHSVRDRAIYYGAPEMWRAWGNLLHSVKTGQSAFENVHATSFYDYLSQHPSVGVPFNRYMTKTSEQHNLSILESYDFTHCGTLVDVGGGQGGTLAAILKAYPRHRGILFDLPEVVKHARSLDEAGVSERCEVVGGDMQNSVPPGGDTYMIKWVLTDRSDERAVEVLKNCQEAMARDGKVLAIDMFMPPNSQESFSTIMDLQMMLLFGRGHIRTEQEYREVFRAAGLAVTQVFSTNSPNIIIESVRN
jgi:O-methyltransferase domain